MIPDSGPNKNPGNISAFLTLFFSALVIRHVSRTLDAQEFYTIGGESYEI